MVTETAEELNGKARTNFEKVMKLMEGTTFSKGTKILKKKKKKTKVNLSTYLDKSSLMDFRPDALYTY